MVKSLEEISDELEINEAILRATQVVDERNWDEYLDAFTEDALLDATAVGMQCSTPRECLALLRAAQDVFPKWQHMLANTSIKMLDADTAKASSIVLAPCVMTTGQVVFTGENYHDVVKRTAAGWRIHSRVVECIYMHNFPEELLPSTDR
jgi:3-phenylpropionate/cinnamic acid dioxygenase small subunit